MFWTAVGFVGNGLAQFLQKLLHVEGFGNQQAVALALMYASGTLFSLLLLAMYGGKVTRKEIVMGLGTAAASYAGNFGVLRALASLPSHVVFPLIVGGPILLVVLWQFCRGEKLSRRRLAGVLIGATAVICLTTRP